MAAKLRPTAAHVERCREFSEVLIPAIRFRAKTLGYAIGVHGSLERDIDLIAAPWSPEAVPPRELADAVQAVALAVIGRAFQLEGEDTEHFKNGTPGAKPHGRRCWTFHLGGGPYVDLSVLQPYTGDEKFEPTPINP